MRRAAAALACGLIFGLGLLASGMADPARVLGFLDVAALWRGGWDPSLALVMAGALAVAAPGFALARRQGRALLGGPLHPPMAATIDVRLLSGAAIFGIGWGLAGFCPGPALTALGAGAPGAAAFVAAMLAGMWTARALASRQI